MTYIQLNAPPHDISTRTLAEASYWAHQFKLAKEWAEKIQAKAALEAAEKVREKKCQNSK